MEFETASSRPFKRYSKPRTLDCTICRHQKYDHKAIYKENTEKIVGVGVCMLNGCLCDNFFDGVVK